MSKWTRTQPITQAEADSEPLDQQLLGPDYERRQRQLRGLPDALDRANYRPWRKPRILRATNIPHHEGEQT